MSGPEERNRGKAAPTELQSMILHAMATGYTLTAIARTFKISERTVHRHLDELARDVGAGSRASLFVEAARRRWLVAAADESDCSPMTAEQANPA